MTPMRHQEWANAYRIVPEDQPPHEGPPLLLVGEDNPQSSDPRHALWPVPAKGSPGCAGKNLQSRILGLPHGAYYGLWRTNACGVRWHWEEATKRVRYLISGDHPWTTIVCLGRKVATCAEHVTGVAIPFFSSAYFWTEVTVDGVERDRHVTVASIPHPSGLSREWNEPGAIDRARRLLISLEPGIPFGTLGQVPQVQER